MVLSFSLHRIPVRVHLPFFLMAAFLGSNWARTLPMMAIWIAVVFGSVLLHELGHAVVGRAFGLAPAIDLHGFGGTTSWAHKRVSSAKKLLISVSGPLVGIIIGQVVSLVFFRDDADLSPLVLFALGQIYYVNFWWGVLNLVPILPLDGGNVMAEALNMATGGRGERPARIVSIGLAVPAALYELSTSNLWMAALAGMFAYQNIQALRAMPPAPPPRGPRVPAGW